MQTCGCPETPGEAKGCVVCDMNAACDCRACGAVGKVMQRGASDQGVSF